MGSKWSKRKRVVVAFVAIIGLIMISILPGLFWEVHEANKVFRSFSNALIAKEYVQAYDFTSPELQNTTDLKSFETIHDNLNSRLGSLTQIAVDKTDVNDRIDGWYATLDTRMIFAHGSLPFTFLLKKEQRTWKIYSYHER
jgi:hypothetical protein